MPEQPCWINNRMVERMVEAGVYGIHEIDGVRVAEPLHASGAAYAQDPETGWWQYTYDVAPAAVAAC